MGPALFDVFPRLAEGKPGLRPALAHLSLGQFPTAIERVGTLLGDVELWIKREDQSGTLYGGNKVRRLEFLFANPPTPTSDVEAAALSQKRILTLGAYASNHVLATGLYGRALGYRVEAVLYPQPQSDRVRSAVRAAIGAEVRVRLCRTYFDVPRALFSARREASAEAPARLVFPGGVDTSGALGWWSGGLEIAAQVAAKEAPRFDAVYVALGAGDTTTGLWLGLGSAASELIGVRVVPWPVASALGVRLLARRTTRLIERRYGQPIARGPRPELRIEGGFVGRGYGYPTPAGARAIARGAELGLGLDPTYTGKVFAALLADADAGRLRGKRVLFIHTYNSRDTRALIAAGEAASLPAWFLAGS
jgi:1-aminocyclopropane-1-carboxylate deaminase/D-cysteine desulfhydrase-like pyridoxal-dependent ACC family enzyme